MAAAFKFVYGLSMVDEKVIKYLRQVVLAHQIMRCRGDFGSISTASVLLNTSTACSNSM